jgi:hypothetical protein
MSSRTQQPSAERVRLQVEMSKDRLASIDQLMEATGMGTRKEFLDNALTLLAWAIRERQKGRSIASVSADGTSFKEVMMPCLDLNFDTAHHESERDKEKEGRAKA